VTLEGLTPEQREVATAPPDARLLVTAGPGTGKTHTLVARIGNLVEAHDVRPGGVLALSFSRAAVGELRRRLRATGEDAGRVRPVTFDSLATRVLAHVDPDGPWSSQSFDGRIEAAVAQVDGVGDLLADIEHVCVDELQDLVGVRMRFVRALLDRLDVGFTLLGDPAQGIYDFSLDDDENPEEDGAPALYSWIRERYAGDLVDLTLTVNHRAKSELAKRAALVGPAVVGSPESAASELVDLLSEAPRLPSIGVLRNVSVDERTAILCRNNGDALWVSRQLRVDGIDHVLQRGSTNRTVAPWVAQLVSATGGGILNRKRFDATLQVITSITPDPDDAWSTLRKVARDDLGIDVSRLVARLREGNIPDELHASRTAPVVVSTVHRAKGLEFDRVVLIDKRWKPPWDDEKARTLFVAMTRTIETLVTADLPTVGGCLEVDKRSGRWLHLGFKWWQRRGFEVRPDDVDVRQPAGSYVLREEAHRVQSLLAEEIQPGDPVELRFLRPKIGSPGASYSIWCRDSAIGLTTEDFGSDLVHILKRNKSWDYPKRIAELSIDAVRTVGGDGLITEQEGLGPGGAWLAPSLVGMGKFEWKD
jgi:hypothetical protein